MGRRERECPEIDWECLGERFVPGAYKVLGQYSKEEGTEKGRRPGDPSKIKQVLGRARKVKSVFTAHNFH